MVGDLCGSDFVKLIWPKEDLNVNVFLSEPIKCN